MVERDAITGHRWRLAGLALLGLLLALVLATFRGYGTVWDEELQRRYGDHVIRWWASGFTDRSAMTFSNLWLYGGLFDVPANLLARASPFGVYETRHLASALLGLAGVAATWRLGALVAGEAAGLLAALLLALVPAWYGHTFANPKDVPFAAFATLALLAMVRAAHEAPRVPWRLVVLTGLATGAALGVRVGGAFLLGYVGLLWTASALLPWRGPRPALAAARALAPRLLAVVAVAWPVMLACWPWALEGPFTRPFEAIRAATRFDWNGNVLFDGQQVWALRLPLRYLPTWFTITLPEAHLLALLAGAAAMGLALRRHVARAPAPGHHGAGPLRAALDLGAVGFAVAFPFLTVLLLRPVMYDGHRQFLFVLPPLAVLMAAGLVRFLGDRMVPRPARLALAAAVAGSLALTAVDMARLHPYETVYFNRVTVGGLPGAAGRFETDYWGQSYRQAIEDVVRHYRPSGPVRVADCAAEFLVGYWLEEAQPTGPFVVVRFDADPDLLVATPRYRCLPEMGRPIHAVTRMGVPLVTVYERRARGTWTGPPAPEGLR
ncbi:MAG: glycosyltransferase family 39 protein [Anaeromyxobacteraceae bacterium]